ncbi:ABC transporter permease [Rufibacter hautae]|uniref:ABC transporter permease n=1 Tax=Rufibacter hautae TaxID=2595005 RepID=A0A5B6TCI9_9BACT|nr:FtsX-like permease family protein [Rufibacter hautae]KAA3436699.1 ABC transporter permease [Rufibacter hautae]
MNLSRYIASRLTGARSDSFTASVTKIAKFSVGLGIAIMIVSFAILEGFRYEIQEKIFSFGGHLQISKFDTNNSFEGYPMGTSTGLGDYKNIPGVAHLQPFARKTAIIKTDDEVLGVVLKGVDTTYDFRGMQANLVSGSVLEFNDTAASNQIMMSQLMADKLRLKVGEKVLFYFIQNPPRMRRFEVKGIFKTGLEEFDNVYVLGDLQQIRDLNQWPDTLVGGYEILLSDFTQIDTVTSQVFDKMNYDLQLEKITDTYAQLFDWLELLKRNVIIFLVLIVFVATFNMVSTLFIMILERTNMIGALKAMGATNGQIRGIFLHRGLRLTIAGLIGGNLLALLFCGVQDYFHLIPLDPENYYMDTVPIHWDWRIWVGINGITFILTMLSILLPTLLIARIHPVKAIKFD